MRAINRRIWLAINVLRCSLCINICATGWGSITPEIQKIPSRFSTNPHGHKRVGIGAVGRWADAQGLHQWQRVISLGTTLSF